MSKQSFVTNEQLNEALETQAKLFNQKISSLQLEINKIQENSDGTTFKRKDTIYEIELYKKSKDTFKDVIRTSFQPTIGNFLDSTFRRHKYNKSISKICINETYYSIEFMTDDHAKFILSSDGVWRKANQLDVFALFDYPLNVLDK